MFRNFVRIIPHKGKYALIELETNNIIKEGTLEECDKEGIKYYLDQLGENPEEKLKEMLKNAYDSNKDYVESLKNRFNERKDTE